MLERIRADRSIRSTQMPCPAGTVTFVPDRTLALHEQFRTDAVTSRLALARCSRRFDLRRASFVLLVAAAAVCAGALVAFVIDQIGDARREELSDAMVQRVVEQIINAESGGNARAVNPRSTATGAGQFIEATWLELARKHLPEVRGRSDAEILQLRYDPHLTRMMTAHLVRRNARILRKRGVPLTPGALYLAHFAGGAGAAAILLAPHDADAALTMARADATGATSREKLVKANPFLAGMTTRDLTMWADLKLGSTSVTPKP